MHSLKLGILIFAVLCSNYQVHSKARIFMKEYNFGGNRVIIGNTHIDKTKWVYALCEANEDVRTAACSLKLENDVLATIENTYSCPVTLVSYFTNGIIDIIGIEPFGEDKVIFTWQDVNYDSPNYADVTVEEIDMKNCQSTKHTLLADSRTDLKPQIFILPSKHYYIISFKSYRKCKDAFCRMTVNDDGTVSDVTAWFKTNDLINALYLFNDYTDMVLMKTENNELDMYYIITNSKALSVSRVEKNLPFGWSTRNGFASLCQKLYCLYSRRDGSCGDVLTLYIDVTKYAVFYNLPRRNEHLAVICDSDPDSNYRIIKIGTDGKEKLSIELEELPCSENYEYMTGQFYQGNEDEYCLSLFHSQYNFEGWFTFRNYCFSIKNSK